ncbi:MAG: hypothetical protein KME26_18705 [Oscillatoria princeps RMCB-10]|jgi:hypothetical protein|nr:hypothetical protein [Oscillatoria princeps RMCB-10]
MTTENNLTSALAKTNQEGIQKHSSNTAIQLLGGIVELYESLKTLIITERANSSIISAEHKAWSKYDRQRR